MDLRELGNLFVIGFHGAGLTSEVRDLLDQLNPAGVILFSRNVRDPAQVATLNHDLQVFAGKKMGSGVLIGVDQEGGRVRRLKEPFTVFPSALELAGSPAADQSVREFAEVTAREIRLVGFNLDFTPVLDVVPRTENRTGSVIGDRAFGSDAGSVARLGRIVIEAMRSSGVIACCKHFPGHGGTPVDSHVDLPIDDRDPHTLEGYDLVPFREAFRIGVEMTMTAHVVYPAIDPEFPATLSRNHITGSLRRRMGFNGVVITDDLDMGAVADRYSEEECGLQAFSAGADLLMFCKDPSKALSARDTIYRAWKDGDISTDRVGQSLARIRDLKGRYAASMAPCDVKSARDQFRV